MIRRRTGLLWGAVILGLAALVSISSCGRPERRKPAAARSDVEEAALKTYVPPGDLDEYYIFYSGGHSGNVYIGGLPSMRHISTIPVFAPYPATGYGFDEESKAMLGSFTWGDAHHPALSETNGDYDGRWLFINDNANNRIARIDLRDFKTRQIFGPIPNVSGNHGSSFVTPNTEYALYASRFSVPIPKGTYASINDYGTKFSGVVGALAIDPQTGAMSNGWQIKMPPFDFDLGDAGKGASDGYAFWTCYNTERATGKLEVTASQRERDYIAMVDWKAAAQAVKDGKTKDIGGVPVIDPAETKGLVWLLPCGKSPHGVDVSPDGKYIVGSGKLQAAVTVFNIDKIKVAIQNKDFEGEEDGIPVLKFDAIKDAEVAVGLGPLHTQFDDKGYAYTSLFLDSAVSKWKLGTWEPLDKVNVQINIGHLLVVEGDTAHPVGKFCIAMNKLSHGQHLNVGPSQPETSQLIDIEGDKMRLIYTAFTEPEPHYAQAITATRLKPIEVYLKEESKNPNAIWDTKDASVTRSGNNVTVKMVAVRSSFEPTAIEVNRGDTVTIYLTNIEQTTDELHGFGLCEYNINVVIDPGETKTIKFVANKPGVYPYYCTNFCSALHQEMQGYLLVK
ncbi:MAG: Sec-dependent nitrous-oxide reductase [Acidobacteriota bacterium]